MANLFINEIHKILKNMLALCTFLFYPKEIYNSKRNCLVIPELMRRNNAQSTDYVLIIIIDDDIPLAVS